MANNVLIGLLSYRGEYHPKMKDSLTRLIRRSSKEGIGLATTEKHGALIAQSRNDIAKLAIENKCSHLLFIDSDMTFDDDALIRLLRFDRDIISGMAVARCEPFNPVAKIKDKDGNWKVAEGLEEGRFRSDLDGVGCAFLLIKTKVFEDLKAPYFAFPPLCQTMQLQAAQKAIESCDSACNPIYGDHCESGDPELQARLEVEGALDVYRAEMALIGDGGDVIGEDYYFCQKAKEAGFDICLDASLIVGHIGEHVYTMTDYFNYKEERESREAEKVVNSHQKAVVH